MHVYDEFNMSCYVSFPCIDTFEFFQNIEQSNSFNIVDNFTVEVNIYLELDVSCAKNLPWVCNLSVHGYVTLTTMLSHYVYIIMYIQAKKPILVIIQVHHKWYQVCLKVSL